MPSRLNFLNLSAATLLLATTFAQADHTISFNTGSFVYHLLGNHGQYTEKFDNEFYSVEKRLPDHPDYSLLVGTMRNSYGDRCLSLGVRKDWAEKDNIVFKGIYGYTGEFFFNEFSKCGDEGIYHSFKNITGVGFAPYIYHAVQYNVTNHFGVESGIIFPSVFVVSLNWRF
ncbi:hypothetical protein [Pseudescherichia sp.]|uniref:hypothetical protein n=1 Tax=Pseudescherichia sp. TaxID=2055881 RepID=UPI00289702AF|nr:hypothetical protein [Pseudescherichia sp.]